ncbi:enoyl-CoA hydratase [Mycobacterium paraintracellulare]|uniref:enoyl-CoA hydratase/isomerase family protein n=1 Tax=Mycobacterium avium TaxID=1764 RepID=UPI001938E55D|nr:enoyl-CoA hydratase-related protein [Mycobacterium avium]BCO39244.1 enoyl-CoA hydratase [Mycobacterium paraintracellulare]
MSDPGAHVDHTKVLFERDGGVLTITLNRPEARNAADHDVCWLIGNALEDADRDPAVRAIIVTGAGEKAFSAGADLKAIARGEMRIPKGMEHWSFAGFANHFTSKPTIAAVNGNALGGGTELALSCDLVVAVEAATFSLPEVRRGLIPAGGGIFRLLDQLPRRVAMRLLLTGESMTAADALRWGLINEVVPGGRALAAARDLALQISANAPLAVEATKRIAYGVHAGERTSERQLWDLTRREFDTLLRTADAQEGPRAFVEKRAPQWRRE